MMVTVDWVARRYGVLPSKLLREGDSIDIILANLGITYENHLSKQANSKTKGLEANNHNLSQEQMLKMIEDVKKNDNN